MFELGSYRGRDCQGWTRRSFLRFGAGLPFAAGFLGGTPVQGAATPKARSVMLVWLVGGPSHLDLFDPKPNAPAEYRGPFAAISTRTAGAQFSELLPRLAASSDRFSVVRTNINYDGGHRPAGSISWTCGKASDGGESGNGKPSGYPPHVGSIVARSRGTGDLPAFISLARGPVGDGVGPCLGYGGGAWGSRYDPFMVDCDKSGRISIPDGSFQIYIMNADGNHVRQLTNHPLRSMRPAWSPDGKRIAFTSARDGNLEIYVIDADGTNTRRITQQPDRDDFPVWHPDGRRLLVISERAGDSDLYLIDVDEN